jgi:hypothetical protein
MTDIGAWLVVGIDPSLSRTGYALAEVTPAGLLSGYQWLKIGSVKPESTSAPIWIRGKAMAEFLKREILSVYDTVNPPRHDPGCNRCCGDGHYFDGNGDYKKCDCCIGTFRRVGLIISMEYPTPMNDFLVALNRIIHLVFFEASSPNTDLSMLFDAIRVLTTNAATLRSLMGLKMRGAKNKKENILRAYDFVNKQVWPKLDTDSCDAILLAEMGKHAADIMLGHDYNVPDRFKNSLCNSNKEVKGAGTRVRIITKGLLHRPEYWYPYEREEYTMLIKDAANPKPGLRRENFRL